MNPNEAEFNTRSDENWGFDSVTDGNGLSNLLSESHIPGQSSQNFLDPNFQASSSNNASNPRVQEETQRRQTVASDDPTLAPTRRSKYQNLDWNEHKAEIQRLYLEENKSLPETMQIMKDRFSFEASQKLFKEKFKVWGWQKNIPAKYARFMVGKQKKRKREENKETVFIYRHQILDKAKVESSAARTKYTNAGSDIIDIDTPSSISYKTPQALATSPINVRDGDASSDSAEEILEVEDDARDLPLSWQGHSITDLNSMWNRGRNQSRKGDSEVAEHMYLDVMEGLSYLLGPTHDDAVKVAFELADFYVRETRTADADKILETLIQKHIDNFGYEHRRTTQHIMQTIELLNGWNRSDDALALLARSKELVATSEVRPHSQGRAAKRRRMSQPERTSRKGGRTSLSQIAGTFTNDSDPTTIDYGLRVAQMHVAAKDEAVEAFLTVIIARCELDSAGLALQNLRARSELLSLYAKMGKVNDNIAAFADAQRAFSVIWSRYDWDKKKFQCTEVMEAGMQLAASFLKPGFPLEAKELFRRIEEVATSFMGWDDERTIWTLISIGLVYQRYTTWNEAEEWFQQAFSAALASRRWDNEDGIVMSLQQAMDNYHFTYVSDEGRPFKTIFGVSGIAIRPGRLHLE